MSVLLFQNATKLQGVKMKLLLSIMLCSGWIFASALNVTVSIEPQKYFVEKIAKDKVDVNVMVKKGFSPATYEPKTSQMKALSSSKAYFSIGVPFEHSWLDKFADSNKSMVMVDTSKNINKIEIQEHEHHEEHADHDHEENHDEDANHDHEVKHDHEEHADHDHEDGLDPHIWLDPILVKTQAKNILDALIQLDAQNHAFYEKNYADFIKELDKLHQTLQSVLKENKGNAFMVFHPSWGYFAQRYNLEQMAVEKEGKEPKPKELSHLIDEAKKHEIKIVFVAPQFSQKAAKIIAKSIGGNVVIMDPLSIEYDTNLLNVARMIHKSYQ